MQPPHPGQQPYPGSSYPVEQVAPQRITPSGWWFAVGALLIAVGVIGGATLGILGFTQLSGKIDDFQRIPVPGTGDVSLTETGGHTVYFEYPGAAEQVFAGRVTVAVTDPSGQPVSLRPYDASVTYTFGKHEGRAAFSFDAGQPGTYRVTTKGDPGPTAAVGTGLGTSFVGQLVGSLGIGFAGLFAGLVVVIVVAVKRSGSKRRAAAGAGWAGRQPPGPQPGPRRY